jgi:hypothetical protein
MLPYEVNVHRYRRMVLTEADDAELRREAMAWLTVRTNDGAQTIQRQDLRHHPRPQRPRRPSQLTRPALRVAPARGDRDGPRSGRFGHQWHILLRNEPGPG